MGRYANPNFKAGSPLESARQFVRSKLGFGSSDYVVKDVYTSRSNSVSHIYLRQKVEGKEVFNANLNVNVDLSGRVVSYGDSFYRPARGLRMVTKFPTKIQSAATAMESFLRFAGVEVTSRVKEVTVEYGGIDKLQLTNIPGALKDGQAVLGWIQSSSGELVPVWDLRVEMQKDYFHSHVSVVDGSQVSLTNWVSHASYRVFPFGTANPLVGDRQLLEDPHDVIASPLGWHCIGRKNFTGTGGNNVYAVTVPADREDLLKNPLFQVQTTNHNFDFPLDTKRAPFQYKKAATTNLFYYNNMIHDLYYRYGFDERAGNFQDNNFGRGGLGADAVIAHAQESSDFNNAYFSTPPDGERGRMVMFLFDGTRPKRDGDLDSGVMIHEYTHGLSTRLTGGPANSDCVDGVQSGGLGEGWGDAMANIINMPKNATRAHNMGIGGYVLGVETMRNFFYSTDLKTNPLLFSALTRDDFQEVHDMGELWATFLYEIYWNLVDKLGAAPDLFKAADSPTQYGNSLLIQLIIDGMKLQPCDPLFLEARDAIVQAELLLTNGQHKCEIWKGFAKRGMGIKARMMPRGYDMVHIDSFEIPKDC